MRERWAQEAREEARGLDMAAAAEAEAEVAAGSAGASGSGNADGGANHYNWKVGWVGNGGPLHLATHLWHAKRFRMERRWGVMVATKANEFGVRAASRFARKTCVVHDASYLAPIEMFATEREASASSLLHSLSRSVLRVPEENSMQEGTAGGSEGRELCGYLCEGERLVAPVSVSIGRCTSRASSGPGVLWIWVHAAAYRDAVAVLARAAKGLTGISSHSLRGEVVRFNVRGPYAPKVLTACLGGAAARAWTLPPGSTIELDAIDPRRISPSGSVVPDVGRAKWSDLRAARASAATADPPPPPEHGVMQKSSRDAAEAAFAALKDSEVAEERERASVMMMPLDALRCERHRWQARFGARTPATYPVTIVAMRGPSRCTDGAASPSFDLVLPSAMGHQLWKNLVLTGAQAVGQDAVRQLSIEDGRPLFPDDYFGIRAHRAYLHEQVIAPREAERKRLPPAKRIPEADEGHAVALTLLGGPGDALPALCVSTASVEKYLNHSASPAAALGLRTRPRLPPQGGPSPASWTPKQLEGLSSFSEPAASWVTSSLPHGPVIPVRVLLRHGGGIGVHAELLSPCTAALAYWRKEFAAKKRKRERTRSTMDVDALGLLVARPSPPNLFSGAYGGVKIGVVTGAGTAYDAGMPSGLACVPLAVLSGLSSHQRRLGVVQGPYVAAYVALRNPGESGRARPVLATIEPIYA